MHERRFHADIERLRSPGRVALLEIDRVVGLCLEGIEAGKVLDVGTGSGLFAEAFAGRGLEVHGLDANPDMVAVAQRFVPGGHFQVAPAEAMPYPEPAFFDLVFLGHVLHEADDPLKVLQEAKRLARTRVAVFEWPYRAEEVGPPLAHRLKPETITALATQAGFQQLELLTLTHMVLYRLDI